MGQPNVICYRLCKRKPGGQTCHPNLFSSCPRPHFAEGQGFSPQSRRIAYATNGAASTFDATNQRQRAGLLFANGKVYAAFTSFCDFHATPSNPTGQPTGGWLLGWSWNTTTLAALPANQLDDSNQARRPTFSWTQFGCPAPAPRVTSSGNLIFSTGNSGGVTWTTTAPCSGTATGTVPTSVPCSNIQESVVKLKGDLTGITGLFSPNAHYGSFSPDTAQLDQADNDLGSGGVLLVPQRGSSFLAAVAGKDGRLFLFDRSGTGLKFLQLRQGIGMLVRAVLFHRSGRHRPHRGEPRQRRSDFPIPVTSLSPEGTSRSLSSTGQDPGFFTTVSCNGSGAFGNCTNTPIIWAVSRPTSSTSTGVDLYAFSGLAENGSYPLLFGPTQVGSWPNVGGNANIVPTVSNGRVYVTSWRSLTISSLKEGAAAAGRSFRLRRPPLRRPLPLWRPLPPRQWLPQRTLSQSPGRFVASMGPCSPSQIAMAKTD